MKYSTLYQHFAKNFPIPKEEWLKLEEFMQLKTFSKNDLMSKPGDDVTHIAIVLKGLFRLFYIGDEGREYIKAFRVEGEMTVPYAEILQSIPSRSFAQAMEDSEVVLVDYSKFLKVTNDHPCWNQLLLSMTQELYIQKEQREFDLLQRTASERYQSFKQTHGNLIERIPQYHIAAYLGITAVALSRIIKKMK